MDSRKPKLAKPTLPKGLEDRAGAIRARVRRADAKGVRHEINQTFRYDPGARASDRHSRSAAVERATAWVAEQRRALRLDKARVGERLEDVQLIDWIHRYALEVEAVHAERKVGRAVANAPKHARKKGAVQELNVLRGWEARFPALCALPPADVTVAHLKAALKALERDHGLAPATMVRWLAVLSGVFTAAVEEWGFDLANPVKSCPPPRIDNARERLIRADEFQAVLDAVPEAHPLTRAAIEFLRWTGCRRGEAVKLDWSDVDRSQPIVEVTFRETKDPRGRVRHRTIPLGPEAEAVLRRVAGAQPPAKGLVFPVHGDSLTTAWGRGCERAGLQNARLHDLRHTRITEITALLPLLDAQRISGHLDLRMLQRYYHPKAQDIGKRWLQVSGKPAPSTLHLPLTEVQRAVVIAARAMLVAQGVDPHHLVGSALANRLEADR